MGKITRKELSDELNNELDNKIESVNGKTGKNVQITSEDIHNIEPLPVTAYATAYPTGHSIMFIPANHEYSVGWRESLGLDTSINWYLVVEYFKTTSNNGYQKVTAYRIGSNLPNVIFMRNSTGSTSWNNWKRIFTSDDITDSTNVDDSNTLASAKAVSILNDNLTQLEQTVNEHSADNVMHITNAERNQWNNMLPIVNTEYNVDPNTTLSGHILTNHINAPIPNRFWYIITLFYNSIGVDKNRTQIAMDYSTSNFAYRSYRDGTWSDWTIIGSKTNLNTTEKTIVGAINEVSNELDSFSEKGIWTPVIRGSTTVGDPVYAAREGEYIRNGSAVYVRARVQLSSKGGMSGDIEIAGLPFACAGAYRVATIGIHNNITYPSNAIGMSGYIGTDFMRPYFNISGNYQFVRLTADNVSDNMSLTFSAVYDIKEE